MHYEISYKGLNADAANKKAIADIKAYLSAKQWKALMAAAKKDSGYSCRQLDLALSFCGVQGFPVFAFMRTYRADEYDAWFASLPEA